MKKYKSFPIQKYPNNSFCPHCKWVSNNKDPKIMGKWLGIKPFKTYSIGVSVFDSREKFIDTFICTNGISGTNSTLYHDYSMLGSLLIGSTYFIRNMFTDFNMTEFLLVISSTWKYDIKSKEHAHALIRPLGSEDDIKNFFILVENETHKKPKVFENLKTVDEEPYVTDYIIELSKENCRDIITNINAFNIIQEIISKNIGVPFNASKYDFYLFLKFKLYIDKGIVTGKLSLNPEQVKMLKLK